MSVPEEIRERIRLANDIVEVIRAYIPLERAGQNYKGRCPFHNEKTPSFMVSPEKQLFHCFGCGAGGDVFTFLMRIENLSFPEALRFLGKRAGVAVPEEQSPEEAARLQAREELQAILQVAARFYQAVLQRWQGAEQARAYLAGRGINAASIEAFGLGYAPPGWAELAAFLEKKGYSLARAAEAGLLLPRRRREGYFDRFRGRLLFPICDARGRVIGFGGRTLGQEEPKYLNTPETPLFRKGENLYGLHLAREAIRAAKQAVVVEGYLDVISAHQAGIRHVVASLGTALGPAQARLLSRYTGEVILAYDADAAGTQANLRGMEILAQEGLTVRVAPLPAGEDPDSLVRKEGGEGLAARLAAAQTLVEYKLSLALEDRDSADPARQVAVTRRVVEVLAGIQSPAEREIYLKEAARRLGISEESLAREVSLALAKGSLTTPAGEKAPGEIRGKRAEPPVRLTAPEQLPAHQRAQRELVVLLLQHPEEIPTVASRCGGAAVFSDPAVREIATALFNQAAAGTQPVITEELRQRARQVFTHWSALEEVRVPEENWREYMEDCLRRVLAHTLSESLQAFAAELEAFLAEATPTLETLLSLTISYHRLRQNLRESRRSIN